MSLYTLTFESSSEYYYSDEEEDEVQVKKPVVAPPPSPKPRIQAGPRGRFVTKPKSVNPRVGDEVKVDAGELQEEGDVHEEPRVVVQRSPPRARPENRDEIAKSLPRPAPAPLTSELRTCHRQKFTFKKTQLTFFERENVLMNAAIGRHQAVIYSGATKEGAPLAVLHIENRKRRFTLVNPDGRMVLICDCQTVSDPIPYTRFFVAKVWVNDQTIYLRSELPRVKEDGRYVINFGGKFTKHSFRNSILLAPDNGRSIIIRKIADNDLELENFSGWNDLTLFGFAIISYACPY